jgi:hypothetical protein
MLYINEWLPNPLGSDTEGEWLELWNSGPAAVDLSGWVLLNAAGRRSSLSGIIEAGEHLVVSRPALKFPLRNRDETLFLHDASGRVADRAGFTVTAPEGQSFSRAAGGFYFAAPTPGVSNAPPPQTASVAQEFEFGVPLSAGAGAFEVVGAGIVMSLILSCAVLFAVKRDHDTSKLFFGRN